MNPEEGIHILSDYQKILLPGDQSEAEERTIFQVINALKAIEDVVEFAMLKKL